MDEMKILLNSANGIDVFGLCETFLTETTENDALSISGYILSTKRNAMFLFAIFGVKNY